MRSPSLNLAGALSCLTVALSPTAQAAPLLANAGGITLSADQLTGASSTAPAISVNVLLGGSAYSAQRPTTPKRWQPAPIETRAVPTFWAISPRGSTAIASQPALSPSTLSPSNINPPTPAAAANLEPELAIALLEQLTTPLATEPTESTEPAEPTEPTELTESAELTKPSHEAATEPEDTPGDRANTLISQSLPPLEEIQQLQEALSNITLPTHGFTSRRVYPGITISNPSGYGADKGQVFAGIGFQSRTRFSGGANPGTIFGGGVRDGTAGIGFGLGNARESVGLQISYTAASFGGSRAPLSGGLNAKLHKQFGNGWAAAIGGEGIINFGRLPEDNDQIEFNDFENTYYGVITKTFDLRENFTDAFSRITLTAGAGSGRFRTVDNIANGEFAIAPFGSAALQVLPSTNLITEWTGQDLAVGVSVAPFPNFPIVFTPAIRDLAGEGDGDPRFVIGVGVSLSDLFR